MLRGSSSMTSALRARNKSPRPLAPRRPRNFPGTRLFSPTVRVAGRPRISTNRPASRSRPANVCASSEDSYMRKSRAFTFFYPTRRTTSPFRECRSRILTQGRAQTWGQVLKYKVFDLQSPLWLDLCKYDIQVLSTT